MIMNKTDGNINSNTKGDYMKMKILNSINVKKRLNWQSIRTKAGY